MDRSTADQTLEGHELTPCLEGPVAQARELERQLLAHDIAVKLAKPAAKACCSGGCGCGSKLQLLVRTDDVPRVQELMAKEWIEAVKREGFEHALVPLKAGPDGDLPCPACGCARPLVEGACVDCGLQLE